MRVKLGALVLVEAGEPTLATAKTTDLVDGVTLRCTYSESHGNPSFGGGNRGGFRRTGRLRYRLNLALPTRLFNNNSCNPFHQSHASFAASVSPSAQSAASSSMPYVSFAAAVPKRSLSNARRYSTLRGEGTGHGGEGSCQRL
jgi:hypothetical protein